MLTQAQRLHLLVAPFYAFSVSVRFLPFAHFGAVVSLAYFALGKSTKDIFVPSPRYRAPFRTSQYLTQIMIQNQLCVCYVNIMNIANKGSF